MTGTPPRPPARFVKAWQFPAPHLRLPWPGAAPVEDLDLLAEEQALVASREVGRLRADLAGERTHRFVATALEAVYRRVTMWRRDLAAEQHHLDPTFPSPDEFDTVVNPDDMRCALHYGAALPPAADGSSAAAAHMAMDQLVRARFGVDAPQVQQPDGGFRLRNRVRVAPGETVSGTLLVLGDRSTWRYAPGARGHRPSERSPYDPRFDAMSVVVPAPVDAEVRMHETAVAQLAELLCEPEPVGASGRFANAAYLLFQAPLHRAGSSDTIRTFLVAVAHLLFTEPLVVPHDIDAQAQARAQTDLPGLDGFVSWFARELPPPLAVGRRHRRPGRPADATPSSRPAQAPARTPAPRAGMGPGPTTAVPKRPAAPDRKSGAAPAPAASAVGGGGGDGGGGGMDAAVMAMAGQVMYATYVMHAALANAGPEATERVEHAGDSLEETFEDWF